MRAWLATVAGALLIVLPAAAVHTPVMDLEPVAEGLSQPLAVVHVRDFAGVAEDAGYFGRELNVYERECDPCRRCGETVRRTVDTGRSTYWCAGCQQ